MDPDPGITNLPDLEHWIKFNVLILPSQDNTELSEDDDQKTNKGQEVEELGKTPVSKVRVYICWPGEAPAKNSSEHFNGSIQLHICFILAN
jgi:hypothetical protein